LGVVSLLAAFGPFRVESISLREHQKINYPRSGVGIPGLPVDMEGLEAHLTINLGDT